MAPSGGAVRSVFLVEHYRPGSSLADLRHGAARIRETIAVLDAGGTAVRLIGSTIVPSDEALLLLIEAPSEALVRLVADRADTVFERISPAVAGPSSRRKRAHPLTDHTEVSR